MQKYGDKPIIKALGGVLGSIAEDAVKRRKFDKLFSLVPYLLIVVEMAQDEEARKVIPKMVDTIKSSDDLWSWINFFNMPADGWETTGEPPALAINTQTSQTHWLDSLIAPAYAGKNKLKRMNGGKVGRDLNKVFKDAKGIKDLEPEDFSTMLKNLREGLINTEHKGLRGLVRNRQLLTSALAVLSVNGAKAVRKLINGKSARISPLVMMAVVTYLESRMSADACAELDGCKEIKSILHPKIRTKYALAFGELFINGQTPNMGLGAQFHLAMIAVQHLDYELDYNGGIEDIESKQRISIWHKKKSGEVFDYEQIKRDVDIVIKAKDGNKKPVWMEVKSLLGGKTFAKNYEQWTYPRDIKKRISKTTGKTYTSEKGATHKQFFLDRIAATDNKLISDSEERKDAKLSSVFNWRLLKFALTKSKGNNQRKSPDPSEIRTMLKALTKLPKGDKTANLTSLGFRSTLEQATDSARLNSVNTIRLFTLKDWILTKGKSSLLSGISDELIDLLITQKGG